MSSETRQIVILGAGGHAREVLDIFEAQNDVGARLHVLGFLVDSNSGVPGTLVNDKPILGGLDWLEGRTSTVEVICGVGAPDVRLDMVNRANALRCRWANAIHPSVVFTRRIEIGAGVVIAAGSVLTNQIAIGNHVHLNVGCTVAHDARIDEFVTISPGVHIAGNVQLGEGAFVGTGASIVDRRHVGEWSVVGAGAVVVADVPRNSTVVGVPARVIKSREPGWQERR